MNIFFMIYQNIGHNIKCHYDKDNDKSIGEGTKRKNFLLVLFKACRQIFFLVTIQNSISTIVFPTINTRTSNYHTFL